MTTRKTVLSLTSIMLATSLLLAGCSTDEENEGSTNAGSGSATEVFPSTTGEPQVQDEDEGENGPDDSSSEEEEIIELEAEGNGWELRGDRPPDPASLEYPGKQAVKDLADATPEGLEPDELVLTAANIMQSWIANEDTSMTVGYRRALNLFVDDFDEIFTPPENPVYPQEWWNAMEHEGVSIGWSTITDSYDDGDTIEYRVVAFPNWVGDDGWSQQGDDAEWTFVVEQDGSDWIIANFTEGGFQ